jgi:hypothetical protein
MGPRPLSWHWLGAAVGGALLLALCIASWDEPVRAADAGTIDETVQVQSRLFVLADEVARLPGFVSQAFDGASLTILVHGSAGANR